MIKLQQDTEGFIRMTRHFPAGAPIIIGFADGSSEECTGRQLNAAYDAAVAEYRTQNHLDAKGFSRSPRKRTDAGIKIEFVRVQPGLAG
ncbi:hypothetical protein [Arthrobacter sp. UYEF3]|uniref:hypothetical protein n=1 Tax=Arthrobacter sp. UYEF3 TaxID=1756365 RepID=UPI0033918507